MERPQITHPLRAVVQLPTGGHPLKSFDVGGLWRATAAGYGGVGVKVDPLVLPPSFDEGHRRTIAAMRVRPPPEPIRSWGGPRWSRL